MAACTDPAHRARPGRRSLQPLLAVVTAAPSASDSKVDGRIGHRDVGRRVPQGSTAGAMAGCGGPREPERAQPRPGGRVGGEGVQLGQGPGGHDLPAALTLARQAVPAIVASTAS